MALSFIETLLDSAFSYPRFDYFSCPHFSTIAPYKESFVGKIFHNNSFEADGTMRAS